MLRIIQNTSVAGAMHYFSSADYYTEGQELTGHWRGTAAAMLGLGGEVRQVDWDAMCQNLHPKTGETLTQRQKEPRRVGYDFNFRAPKGLSMLYGLTGDERLLDAFRGAVDATMREMEREVQTRVRKDGRSNEDRTTGNLAWGEFIHFTSRPVDGIPDPHLHAHCFAFNATWDPDEKRWKAGQFAGLKRDAPYFEARFHSRLAERLGDLGIGVVRNKSSWELAGLSRDVIEKFSRRTALIEEKAEEKGITDPERKMELSTKTREKKRKELSLPELRKQWAERLTPDESDAVRQVADRIGKGPVERDANAADRAADLAVSHVFERKAVVPERTLLREALKRSLGQASVDAAERAIARKDILTADREGRRVVTTKEVLMEEQKMIDFAREGRGTCRAFAPGEHAFTDARLNAQQRSAVAFVLNSRDRVMVIRGAAGVGKTTMMKEAVSAIEASGTEVFTFAPSTDASRTVLRDEGFADADTVARLLVDERLQEKLRGQAIWIDEAGLMGTKTVKEVFDLADKLECRVILSGDRRQHGSVERGAALRLLETEAGLVPAEIREIQRQSGAYKQAVEAISEGRLDAGFKQLDDLHWIKEVRDDRTRDQAIADDYVATALRGKTCLVVAPTHFEGDRVTRAIREKLKGTEVREKPLLGSEEHEFASLRNLGMTEADRRDPASYQAGDVLVFNQNAPGITKGERRVVGDGELPLEYADRFNVYREDTIKLAVGDAVRVTQNGSSADGKHKLNNGSVYRVKSFTERGEVVLDNGWTLAKNFGHLTYGYCTTSHGSQGKSVKRVLIAESSWSLPAASREQFYVSISRGREDAMVYTDDKAALLAAVQHGDDRLAATDLLAPRGPSEQQMRRERALVLDMKSPARDPQVDVGRERDSRAIQR